MSRPNFALIGRARSGKDSTALRLGWAHGYTRLAFADALKTSALDLDPIVASVAGEELKLSYLVNRWGWDHAKERHPEVRRILQYMGQGIRDMDPDFWLRPVLNQIEGAKRLGWPVVVTDVRYRNEVEALKAEGFRTVRVIRPRYPVHTATAQELTNRRHRSETELDSYACDLTLNNDSGLRELSRQVDALLS